MTEFKYIIDQDGNKTAVIIDLTKDGKLWEDFLAHKGINPNQQDVSILQLGNLFSKEDLTEIENAVKNHCEAIDTNAW